MEYDTGGNRPMSTPSFTMTSTTYTANLNMPGYGKIIKNKTNEIQLLNFWSGEITVLDKNTSNDNLILSGIEYTTSTVSKGDISNKVDTIFDIQNDGEEITITNLEDSLNNVYIIKSFGIETTKPWSKGFKYDIELEYVRDV